MLWKKKKIRKKVRTTEVNKIVTVVLKKDDISYADEAYQWNYGQILRIQGGNLPKVVEVHFSLEETSGTSVTRIGTTVDGVTEAPIPDSLLENNNCFQDYTIYAYIYLEDGTAGRTEHEIAIPVKARTKPEVPGTPEEPELFRETVKAVNDAADRAETAVADAEEIRDNLNLDLSEKITRPQTAEVGQVLAVKETDEDGTPTVFEAQDVKVPTKTSELKNDSGFLTEHQDISGKLDKEKLPEAIDDALTQAKESGEFDGKDGAPGEKGDPGETTYVENPYDDTKIKEEIAAKVGYSEVVDNQLLMYADDTKEKLLATMELPSGVEDTQINGTSIVENGIANIPAYWSNTANGIELLNTKTKKIQLRLVDPSKKDISNRQAGIYQAINTLNYDYTVKSAMSAPIADTAGMIEGVYHYPAWTAEERAAARERMGTWVTIADITLEEDASMIGQIEIHGYRKYEIIVTLPSVIKTDCFIQPKIRSVTGQTTSMAYESAKNAQFLLFEIEEFFYCGGENYATFIGCESYKGEVGAITPGNKKYSSVMLNYNSKEVYPYIASVGLIANGTVFPSGSRIAIRGCD